MFLKRGVFSFYKKPFISHNWFAKIVFSRRQLWPASHWPEMRVLILVASDARKKVPR